MYRCAYGIKESSRHNTCPYSLRNNLQFMQGASSCKLLYIAYMAEAPSIHAHTRKSVRRTAILNRRCSLNFQYLYSAGVTSWVSANYSMVRECTSPCLQRRKCSCSCCIILQPTLFGSPIPKPCSIHACHTLAKLCGHDSSFSHTPRHRSSNAAFL